MSKPTVFRTHPAAPPGTLRPLSRSELRPPAFCGEVDARLSLDGSEVVVRVPVQVARAACHGPSRALADIVVALRREVWP